MGEDAVRRFREINRVQVCLGLLMGLSLFSYHVRELLVCWIFFVLLFVAVAAVILGGVLAWHAAEAAVHRAGGAPPAVPALALDAGAELPVKAVLDGSKLE